MSDTVLGGPARAWHRLKSLGYASPFYRMTLGHGAPSGLALALEDPWEGDPERGNAMFQGRFRFAGLEATAPNQPPWRLRPDAPEWTRELHGFAWLRHFRAVGGTAAVQHARRLVRSWIDLCGDWEPLIWDVDVVGRRLVAWVGQAGFLLDGADEAFRAQFLESLHRQWRHLGRDAGSAAPGAPALAAALGLLLGALALGGREAKTARGLGLLQRELEAQVLADGGHVSRSPSRQMQVLRELVWLRDAFKAAEREVPEALQIAIDRMAPVLRAFRHGDGALALFNGGFEETPEAVEATLVRAEADGAPLANASHSGFQRLSAGRSVLIADTGAAPGTPLPPEGHAGALSFEFSSGRQRLVVNCGSGLGRDAAWRSAMRVTAAHSALVVEDTNNMELPGPGRRAPKAPGVKVERNQDDDGNVWLDVRHMGYAEILGLTHRRRLYLAAGGQDLRGEDRLVPGRSDALEREFRIRFHLHPAVKASLVEDGTQVLLGLKSGEGWRFRASGARAAIEESIYLGRRDNIRRTEQVVLSGRLAGDHVAVKWAFRKL